MMTMKRTDGWGKRIQSARLAQGMSVAQFARKVRRTQQTVYRWESDQAWPRRDDWEAIAKVLGTSVAELVDRTAQHNNPSSIAASVAEG